MARKALLVACSEFRDSAFQALTYPASDAERFAAVLRDPELCFFDEVQILSNATLDAARRAVFGVTDQAGRDDLVLVYFSGHGALDKDGSLTLVLPETESDMLAATALAADDLKRAFNRSRAAQKVLILDCCYAGAMGPDKMKSSAAESVSALAEAGSGTFILTASTKFQPAFERAELGGSVLTHCLVDGIAKGEAAPDAETVTLSALAAYVKTQAPTYGAQQPQFWDFGSKGEIVFARRPATFDAAWRAQVSQLIAQRHVDGDIEYDMHEQIRAVIVAPTDAANRPAKDLIEQLRRRKIGLARFGSAWADLQAAAVTDAPPAQPTPVSPPPDTPVADPPSPEAVASPATPPATPRPGGGFWPWLHGGPARSSLRRYAPPLLTVVAGLICNSGLGPSLGFGPELGFAILFVGLLWLQLRFAYSPWREGTSRPGRAVGILVTGGAILFGAAVAISFFMEQSVPMWALVFALIGCGSLWIFAQIFFGKPVPGRTAPPPGPNAAA